MAKGVKLPYSVIMNKLEHYLLPPDEVVFFEWLIEKHVYFGRQEKFHYAQRRIENETRIKRRRLDAIIRKFEEMGFVSTRIEALGTQPKVTYFYVNISCMFRNLGRVIDSKTEYYREWDYYLYEVLFENPMKPKKKVNVDKIYKLLNKTYNDRINMYNDGELTYEKPSRIKLKTALPRSKTIDNSLTELVSVYGEDGVDNAFLAFIDQVLKENISCKRPLNYFLKKEGGTFVVFNEYLDYYNVEYSKKR